MSSSPVGRFCRCICPRALGASSSTRMRESAPCGQRTGRAFFLSWSVRRLCPAALSCPAGSAGCYFRCLHRRLPEDLPGWAAGCWPARACGQDLSTARCSTARFRCLRPSFGLGRPSPGPVPCPGTGVLRGLRRRRWSRCLRRGRAPRSRVGRRRL